eukprot:3251869-Lingulodinium_polyedra.AAC.1
MPSGQSICLRWETPEGRTAMARRFDDARILPVKEGPTGRSRTWSQVVEDAKEEAYDDWPIKPPRTAKWCAVYLLKEGGPMLHHEMWRSKRKLQLSDYGVETH